MNAETLPDIPRLYTALAEWAGCAVYILLLKKRFSGPRMVLGIALSLPFQALIQLAAGALPLALWVPGMIAAVGGMHVVIRFNSGVFPRDALYCCISAFILAEFAASLSWQLYCYFFMALTNAVTPGGALFTLLVYALVFVPMFFFERRHMEQEGKLHVRRRELWSAALIAAATFVISNISFVSANTPFSSRLAPELFYIRTLVDFCGLVILYAHQEQRREMQLQSELKAVESLLQRQFAHYQRSRESMDIINRKYHDMKHQIAVIRAERDPAKQAAYLDEIDNEIKQHEIQYKTGNGALDTVLADQGMICKKNNISLACVADGALLDFMDAMDICSIFGNALDNAVEGVLTTEEPEKRLIRVALYSQNKFILICFENYFEGDLKLENGLPATTKRDKGSHGFGLKSIRYAVEKYGGSMTVNIEETWFIVRILLPLP
ncbi:MAG: GHKL domain-containing protein [Treponema sp.]|jgi:nitrogen fixation/metabolism regulation signal transduction histidine kinase|nr:GHKL domain-containing protein [Treponema sp.]